LRLPVPGSICRKVQKGYKVFDLNRNIAIKVFDRSIEPEMVQREYEHLQRIGALSFAPSLHNLNLDEMWYEEDYVNGYRLPRPEWEAFLPEFHEFVPPHVARILFAFPFKIMISGEYAEELSNGILAKCEECGDKCINTDSVSLLKVFLSQIVERLRAVRDRPIYLGCSHGDFSTRHLLVTKTKGSSVPVLIDWERSDFRSLMYDLHDAFFKRIRRVGCVDLDAHTALEKAIFEFRSIIKLNASGSDQAIITSLNDAELYRSFYFIEKIYMLLGSSISDAKLEIIISYIHIFRASINRYLRT
jgi:hypothetical protein